MTCPASSFSEVLSHAAKWTLVHGDSLAVLPTMPPESVDAVVTDPPYELGFMGKSWDSAGVSFRPETWAAMLRVLKPGGYLVAFGGSRTFHRIACAIEDAGFDIRDTLSWMYGTGFPKSMNLGDGRGTALKPAWEPIILARKSLAGTVAANVQAHGTGALNIDGCRIETTDNLNGGAYSAGGRAGGLVGDARDAKGQGMFAPGRGVPGDYVQPSGRWPANVVLDEEAAAALDAQTGMLTSGANPTRRRAAKFKNTFGEFQGQEACVPARGVDSGGASRFFYVAKASRAERDEGCESLPVRSGGEATDREDGSPGAASPRAGAGRTGGARNVHPTVKPVALMRWLVRLVTPPGGIVLDPFTGSGTTGLAALHEGLRFVGVEQSAEYLEIARCRVGNVAPAPSKPEVPRQGSLFGGGR
ncbi:site-specific DNA-methyltransferase [Myxococcus sp. CA040A]|uniref:DNA-methyltransferase n=1 Tax=Myxococcus sp. CA040A TaxID=2741738 RepID=UPI0020C5C080|nr:site-specific DNA-methyltransferase [Myxococcus sp. CA040A]